MDSPYDRHTTGRVAAHEEALTNARAARQMSPPLGDLDQFRGRTLRALTARNFLEMAELKIEAARLISLGVPRVAERALAHVTQAPDDRCLRRALRDAHEAVVKAVYWARR